MAYIALYRKWRPGTFSTLVGQEHVSVTLSNAITQGKIAHAYLFTGPRGTGKTSTAKILAKALNCEKGPTPEPCNVCENCRRINEGTSMDVYEIDAASNRGIDEIRDLRETVKYSPVDGRYKVYIIDEVHMLTTEAFNALLKTLEEPPENVVFVLATTEAHKVPMTVQSRCQRYDFKRISQKEIEERLSEVAKGQELSVSKEALSLIAAHADGGMRDALSILDQCASLAQEEVTQELVREVLGIIGHEAVLKVMRAIAKGDCPAVLTVIDELLSHGRDVRRLVVELISALRAAMVYRAVGKLDGVTLYESDEDVLKEEARLFEEDAFLPLIRRLNETLADLRYSSEPRLTVETSLLALCRPEAANVTELVGTKHVQSAPADEARIAALEAKLVRLTAELEKVKAAPVSATPTKQAMPKKTSAPTKMPPAPKKSSQARPLAVTAEGRELFKRLREKIETDGKGPFKSCLGAAEFAGMDEHVFRIQTKNAFVVNRITQGDYRAKIEAMLEELNGAPLRLECLVESEPPPPPPPPPEPERVPGEIDPPDFSELSEDERSFMENSIKQLGGDVTFVDGEIHNRERDRMIGITHDE